MNHLGGTEFRPDFTTELLTVPQLTSLDIHELKLLAVSIHGAYDALAKTAGNMSWEYDYAQEYRLYIRNALGDMAHAALKSNPVSSSFVAAVEQINNKFLSEEISFGEIAGALLHFCTALDHWISDAEAPMPDPFPSKAIKEGLFKVGMMAVIVHRRNADLPIRLTAAEVPIEGTKPSLGNRDIRRTDDFPNAMTGVVPESLMRESSEILFERQQLVLCVIEVINFIAHCLDNRKYTFTFVDKGFLALADMVSRETGHILRPSVSDPGPSVLYNPGRASDAFRMIGAACDLLLVRNDACKHVQMDGSTSAQRLLGGILSNSPKGKGRLLHLDDTGALLADKTFLGALGKTCSGIRVPLSPRDLRQAAILESSGSITPFDNLVICLFEAARQLDDFAQGSAFLAQNGRHVSFEFLAALQSTVTHMLPNDPRAKANPNSISMKDLVSSVTALVSTTVDLFSGAEAGGCLVCGNFGGYDHQIPPGTDPLAMLAKAISAGCNGAHVGATTFPHLEERINYFLQKTGVLFKTPWPKGQIVPTSGGTPTNTLSATLAFASAGAGLALKRAAHATDIDLLIMLDGQPRQIKTFPDSEAIRLPVSVLSEALGKLQVEDVPRLQPVFKENSRKLLSECAPLVALPDEEWVHYTLVGWIEEQANKDILRVPLNENAELDFNALRVEVAHRYEHNFSPLIIPLTFCNTGLGMMGFSIEGIRDFNNWYRASYNAEPIYIIDAAQGGITFGLSIPAVSREVQFARDFLAEFALTWTVDPHKYWLPVPASMFIVRDAAWAKFATARSVGHSYLKVGDAATLREAVQLSAPLETTFSDLIFLLGLESGQHEKIMAPALSAAKSVYTKLGFQMVTVNVDGESYRLVAPFESHSGILGVCFVPTGGSKSMAKANEALMKVREYLYGDRTCPLTCSKFSIKFKAFSETARPKIQERFIREDLDWTGVETLEFLRLVFRQGGQDALLLEELPKLISGKFG